MFFSKQKNFYESSTKQRIVYKNLIWLVVITIAVSFVSLRNLEELDIVTVLNDEFGYWGCGAVIAGINWKPLLAETPYYSFGYSILLAPIIRITHNPASMYKLAILLNVVFVLLCFVLVTFICRSFIGIKDDRFIFFVAFISVFTIQNIYQIRSAWPEILISLLMWVSVYTISILEEKLDLRYFFLLMVTFLAMIITHRRTIPVVIIGIILFLIKIMLDGNRKIFFVCIAMALLLIAVSKQINSFAVMNFYSSSHVSNLNNSSVTESATKYMVHILSLFSEVAKSLAGKTVAAFLSTYMLCGVVVFSFLRTVIKREKLSITKAYIVLSFLAMLLLTSCQVIGDSRKDLPVYTRYFDFTIGPVIFLGVYILKNFYSTGLRYLGISGIICCLLTISVSDRIALAKDFFNVPCSPLVGGLFNMVSEHKEIPINSQLAFLFGVIATVVLLMTVWSHESGWNLKYYAIVLIIFFTVVKVTKYSNDWLDSARDGFRTDACVIANEIKDENGEIYYVKFEDQTDYCVYAKFVQYLLYDRTINVIPLGMISSIPDDALLMANNENDLREAVSSENLELVAKSKKISLFKKSLSLED